VEAAARSFGVNRSGGSDSASSRAMEKQAALSVAPGHQQVLYAPPPTPAGFALRDSIDHSAANVNFAPGSRLTSITRTIGFLPRSASRIEGDGETVSPSRPRSGGTCGPPGPRRE
jgi:hypothetical protein